MLPGMVSWFTSHVTSASKTKAGGVQELVHVFWISSMPKSTVALQEGDREGGTVNLQSRPGGIGEILVSYSTLWVTAFANERDDENLFKFSESTIIREE